MREKLNFTCIITSEQCLCDTARPWVHSVPLLLIKHVFSVYFSHVANAHPTFVIPQESVPVNLTPFEYIFQLELNRERQK